MQQRKAIALFSGGLDSILTVKLMQQLGYTVYPVFFDAPYFPTQKAIESAELNGIDLIVRDITPQHLTMIQNPRCGYGKHFNPCIDCHAMMFNLAGKMLAELGADFLVSGEVLGQRPMSQRRQALQTVANLSGFGDLLVRPLCQQLLPDTLPIREGWVDKNQLLGISGRSRKEQMVLAKELGITRFPAPGGGCLLTDRNYTLRLRDLIEYEQQNQEDLKLLRYGRHFRISPKLKLVMGRDNTENEIMWNGYPTKIMLHAPDYQGPLGMLIGEPENEAELKLAACIVLSYVNKAPSETLMFYGRNKQLDKSIMASKLDNELLNDYIISIDNTMGQTSKPKHEE